MVRNYYFFMTGRILMGVSIGIKLVASLRMVEEYSPQSFFPILSTMMYASIAFGALLSATYPYTSPQNFLSHWRWTIGANILTNSALLFSLAFIIRCDSPKFYN
jgi:MFS family permease